MIRQDVLRGIKESRYRYAICVILIFILIIMNNNSMRSVLRDIDSNALGMMDNIMYMLKGMSVYIEGKGRDFKLPVCWMTVQFACSVVVFNYIKTDIRGIGTGIIIRMRSKKKWWLSKCIWNVCSVALLYILLYAGCCIVSLMYNGTMGFNREIFLELNGVAYGSVDIKSVILFLIFMPMLTSIALSLLQMCMSIVISPVISLMSIMVIDILSCYFTTPFLVGNYSMLLRSAIYKADGISLSTALAGNIIIIAVAVVLGMLLFDRSDLTI